MDRIPHDDGTRPCAVYRLFNADGRLLYVGMCFNVASRMTTHKKRAAWWGEVAGEPQVTWMANRASADAAETIAINLEDPKYNFRKKMDMGCGGLNAKAWLPTLGTELRCTDTVTPASVSQAAAPSPLAAKIGIADGSPMLLSAQSLVREGRAAARLAYWVSPLPGNVPAVDRRNGSSLLSAYAEHRRASSEEAAAIGVETGCPVDAAWKSPEDRTVPGRLRRSIAELVTVCQCPDGTAEPVLALTLDERWEGWKTGGHPRAEVVFQRRNWRAWYCPDCDEMLPDGWRPLRSAIDWAA